MEIKNRDGRILSAVLNRPSEAHKLVIMCHGFANDKNAGSSLGIEEILNEAGIATLRYDAKGHGDSYGEFEDVTVSQAVSDLVDVMDYADNLGWVSKIGVYGSSFGGMTAFMAAGRNNKADVLALKAPVSNWTSLLRQRLGSSGIREWKNKGYWGYPVGEKKLKLNYSFFKDLCKVDSYAEAKEITCPSLIVHGSEDEVVPVQQSMKLNDHLENSSLKIIPGADHRFSDHREKVFSIIAEWIKKNL